MSRSVEGKQGCRAVDQRTFTAQSMASVCMSSDMSAFLMTALRSVILLVLGQTVAWFCSAVRISDTKRPHVLLQNLL